MEELSNIQPDGGSAEAALEAHRIALGGHQLEFLVEVLHHPDHEPRHIHVKRDATLLEALDEAARKLDVKLLPIPAGPAPDWAVQLQAGIGPIPGSVLLMAAPVVVWAAVRAIPYQPPATPRPRFFAMSRPLSHATMVETD